MFNTSQLSVYNRVISDCRAFETAKYDGMIDIDYEVSRASMIEKLQLLGFTNKQRLAVGFPPKEAVKTFRNCYFHPPTGTTILFDHRDGKASVHALGSDMIGA